MDVALFSLTSIGLEHYRFFPVLEAYGELIEDLVGEVVENPTQQTLGKIHQVKRELLILRRAIWPQ